MRLLIRPEQMSVINAAAEEKFARRLEAHLRSHYPNAAVILPDQESTVKELAEETLNPLVKISIERARSNGFTYESSISAYSALMFEVAPNFDMHELVQPFLADENIEPNARLKPMLEKLTEKDWEEIRKSYDAEAWQPKPEKSGKAEETKEEK